MEFIECVALIGIICSVVFFVLYTFKVAEEYIYGKWYVTNRDLRKKLEECECQRDGYMHRWNQVSSKLKEYENKDK